MKKQVDLKNKLLSIIKPLDIFKEFFSEIQGLDENHSEKEINSFCPFHDDESGQGKSFSFNTVTGKYCCRSTNCGIKGTNVINFFEKINDWSFDKTLSELYSKYVRPIVPMSKVNKFNADLLDSPRMMKYLTSKRLLSEKIINDRKIGYNGDRLTIPIYNEYGMCINLRMYNSDSKAKMISYGKGYGKNYLYPIDNSRNSEFILVEGEWDALVLESYGFTAMTFTVGSGSPAAAFSEFLAGRDIIICYDSDDAGKAGSESLSRNIRHFAKSIKIVNLPKSKNIKDISDYFVAGNTRDQFAKLISDTKFFSSKDHSKAKIDVNVSKEISLIEASNAKWYYKRIKFKARVSGKETSPYYLPKKVSVSCMNFEKHNCFCSDSQNKTKVFDIDVWDKNIIKLISTTDSSRDISLLKMLDVPSICKPSIEILTNYNAEQVRLTPDLDFSDGSKFIARRGVYIGSDIDSNKSYEFEGYTINDPYNQQIVHILVSKKETADSLDNFFLTPTIISNLKKFKPKKSDLVSISKKFNSIAQWQSDHVTKIKQRLDLHILVDLCFNSVSTFKFDDEIVHKAMVEILIIGDTRCGKGMVAEGLSKYYQLGRVASGENCTYAGLVGGVQQMSKGFLITWGLIPEQDKGLYIIDEVSSMTTDDIGKMSRVRSEGIAEITKIITEKTLAKSRAIWISNSRTGKDLQTYNNGCDAIPELIGSMEDVSRFDLFITATKGDVSSEDINSKRKFTTAKKEFCALDFKNLALWAWSRKQSEIKFIPSAIDLIYSESIRLGKKYSAAIPLVQSENIRIKLSKISTAVAAKCFSTFNEYSGVMVKSSHVEYAAYFMEKLLDTNTLGYNLFSKAKLSQSSIQDEVAIDVHLQKMGKYMNSFVEGMLDQKRLSISDISDFIGQDSFDTKELVGSLVRLRCLQKEYAYYVKKPSFIDYLRRVHLKEFFKGQKNGNV